MAVTAEQRAHIQANPLSRDSQLLVRALETKPFEDPQRQLFYAAVKIIEREERIKLLLAFPASSVPVFRSELISKIYPPDYNRVSASGNLIRTLQTDMFSGAIAEGSLGNSRNKSHQLTPRGLVLRKVAEIAKAFLEENPGFTKENFKNEEKNFAPSPAERSEILFSLLLSPINGLRQADLANLLSVDNWDSTFYRTFMALQQNGFLTVDQNNFAHITERGIFFVDLLLGPIAKLTGYPTDRISAIEAVLQPKNRPANIIDLDEARRERRQRPTIQAQTAVSPAPTVPVAEPLNATDAEEAQGKEYYSLIPLSVKEEDLLIRMVKKGEGLQVVYKHIMGSEEFSPRAKAQVEEAVRHQNIATSNGLLMFLYYDFIQKAAFHTVNAKNNYNLKEAAEDLAQKIIDEKFSGVVNAYDPDKADHVAFRYYLRRAITFAQTDNFRRGAKEATLTTILDFDAEIKPSTSQSDYPELTALIREREEEVRKAIDKAFAKTNPEMFYKEVILMRYWYDMGYEEIAGWLDIPPSTVKARLHNAREILEKILLEKGLAPTKITKGQPVLA